MKKTSIFFALFLSLNFIASFAAHASTTWNYAAEPAGPIYGGSIRISVIKSSDKFKVLKLKWKVDTSVGAKKDWLPYHFPIEVFKADYLGAMAIGQTKDVGSFPSVLSGGQELNYTLKRLSENSYVLNNGEMRFTFVANKNGGAWRRIDAVVRLKGITLNFKGGLVAITPDD